jgi:GntR family transcriptional regulator, arabinose operon transcriptional repressor
MDTRLPENQRKHQLVFDELQKEIATGKYQAGQKLPSEAALVRRFGASRTTVGRAVRDLRQHGLVDRRAGSGTYVRPPQSRDSPPGLTFGLLIPDLGRTDIFEPICQGMADTPEAAEHALLWCNTASGGVSATGEEQASQFCQQFISRAVSGVFFAPFESLGPEDQTNRRIVNALDQARIPVVLLDRDFLPYPRRSRHDLVGIDNRRAGFMAAQHLLDLGCRRLAFLSYPCTAATVDERIAGYREALMMRGLPIDPSFVHRLPADDLEGVRIMMATLKPDGFVCANDRTAGRLMQTLISLGTRIPQDVRIVGIDDITYASLLPVPLTTVHQPCREIGIAAMTTMLERIRRPGMAARDVLLETNLVIRDSCGAKTRRDANS